MLRDTSHLETTESRSSAERASRQQLAAGLAPMRVRAATDHVKLNVTEVSGGDPADQIADYADEHGFDLVVVGSHGQDQATHGGPGRVVERLVRDPSCPILVVPYRAKG